MPLVTVTIILVVWLLQTFDVINSVRGIKVN